MSGVRCRGGCAPLALFRRCRPTPGPSLKGRVSFLREARGTLFLRWGEKDGRFGWTDRLNLAPSEANRLEDILHLQRVDGRVQLLYLGEDGIKLLFVRRMREASIKARSIAMVDGEADGAAVVEGIEDSAVGKVVGDTTLLEHLAGEGGEDELEGFVEEHEFLSFFIQKYASLQKY